MYTSKFMSIQFYPFHSSKPKIVDRWVSTLCICCYFKYSCNPSLLSTWNIMKWPRKNATWEVLRWVVDRSHPCWATHAFLKKWSNSNSSGDLLKSLRFLFLRHGPSSIGFYMFFPHPYYPYPSRPAKMSFWGRGLDLSSMRYGISMRYSCGGWTCNSAMKKRCPPVLKRGGPLRVSPCVIFLGDGCYFVPSWSQRVLLDMTTWAHHENPPNPHVSLTWFEQKWGTTGGQLFDCENDDKPTGFYVIMGHPLFGQCHA